MVCGHTVSLCLHSRLAHPAMLTRTPVPPRKITALLEILRDSSLPPQAEFQELTTLTVKRLNV